MHSNFSKSACLLVIFLLSGLYQTSAQSFLKPAAGSREGLSFQEMQLRFDQWAKSVDLKQEKNWKYFKRWEQETQFHTDAKGNPVDPELYMSEVLKATDEKNKSRVARFMTSAWSPVGPNFLPNNQTGYMENGIGRINCMAFHPSDPNTFFIGVAQGGVWKTTNGGNSWTPLTDQLPILRISDISIDPVNPNIMYIAVGDFEYIGFGLKLNGKKRNTHYGLGVYKTTDGGATWQPTALSFQLTQGDASLIRKILINPTNTNQLVACGTSGLYTSNNAGASWTQKMDSLFWDLVVDPVNNSVLYAATGWVQTLNTGSAGIYKSTDFGSTWSMLNTGIPQRDSVQRIKLAIAPSDPNYIYAFAVDIESGMYGIYKSTNAGANWQFIPPALNVLSGGDGTASGGQGTYDLGFLVNATNKNILYTGGVNMYTSTDGGQSFDPVAHWTLFYGPTIHGDIHFITRQPVTNSIFVCSDGGLYRTSAIVGQTWMDADNGSPWPTQWTTLNDGFAISCFYRVSSSKNTTGRLIAGAQDNASIYFDGSTWSTIFGGDGMDNYLDPLDDNTIVGSSQFGNFYVSNDNGFTANGWNSNPNNEVAEWTTPVVADENNPGTFYIGNANVYQSTDYGNNWNQISSFLPPTFADNEICAMAIAKSNSNVIVAAKRVRYEYGIPGVMYRTANGGSSWTDITAGLPDSIYYTSVDVNSTDANSIYVSMAGLTPNIKVFRSSNGGSSWQNISYNLPNLPVNCVKNIPGTNDLIAATDIGVYVLDSGSTIWDLQSTNLPNVIVSDIEFNPSLNKIYISTFGRGIWETSLSSLVSIPIQQQLSLNAVLFPTVNDGNFTIRFSENKNVRLTLDIIDIKGAIVYTKEVSGNGSVSISAQLLSGKYFARLRNAEMQTVQSFIVK